MIQSIIQLKKSKKKLLVLHYACTSVNIPPVIVTNISIRDYSLNQTFSFSYAKYTNEKDLLLHFLEYINKFPNALIITWNQKSSTYGMQHLEERCHYYKIEKKFKINYENIIDLDDSLTTTHGPGYATNPKLAVISKLNNITSLGVVNGLDEIRLFKIKEYKRIENSTNRKVAMMADILRLSFQNTLKTNLSKPKKSVKNPKNKINKPELIDAHFFFVDIVGLSDHKLTSAEEQIKKINILTKSIKSSKVFKSTKEENRLILPTGDGMVIGFKDNIESPLKLALELHEKLNSDNKTKEKPSQIEIRIGIHSAPVLKFIDIKDQENFWGEGVITSRRIMDLGNSKHILLSDEMARNLMQLSEYRKILYPVGKSEIKHGSKIGIYSAYGKDFGNKINPKITKAKKEKLKSSLKNKTKLELQLLQNKKKELIAQRKHELNMYNQNYITDEDAFSVSMSETNARIQKYETQIVEKKLELEKLN